MRARLGIMVAGEEFYFICEEKMAEKIGRIVTINDGEIINRDIRSSGVVIIVRKKEQ